MTPDEYVLSTVARYTPITGPQSPPYIAAQKLYPIIASWANKYLDTASFSGSYAKGTPVRGTTDVDIFISLHANTPGTLGEIYENLYSYLIGQNLAPSRQNVSVGLTYAGVSIDLVPGRKQSDSTTNHSLYKNKAKTWTLTNVDKHIEVISTSGRLVEIRALKIWRALHGLDFPSFYLELIVLDALHARRSNQPAQNVLTVFEYLVNSFENARVVDPANTNNIISDDLTANEKAIIISAAQRSRAQQNWETIIW